MAFGFQGQSHAGDDLNGPYIPPLPGKQYTVGSGVQSPYYGGYGSTVTYDKDGNPTYDYSHSGAGDASARYQGMGAQQYGAPQLDKVQSDESRFDQREGLEQLEGAMMGNAPSRAQILARQANEGAIAGTMSTAASIKGGPGARIAAMRGAQSVAAGQEATGNRDIAALRADEIARAREAYMAGATGMRGQDIGQAGADAQLQAQTNALNEGRNEYYEGLGNKVQEDQLNANLGFKNADTNAWGTERSAKLQDEAQEQKGTGAMLGFAGGILGGISDVRAKEDIYPVGHGGGIVRDNPYGGNDILRDNPYGTGDSPAPQTAGRSPLFDALSGMGAGMRGAGAVLGGGNPSGAYMPMPIRSDERAKYIVSDGEAKTSTYGMMTGVDTPRRLSMPMGGRILSDANAKRDAFAEGAEYAVAAQHGQELPLPTYAQQTREVQAPRPAETNGAKRLEVRGPQTAPAMTRSQPWRTDDDPMADANRSYEPSAYHYKPGFGEDPNRPNVGPMAQNMARDPVASTAIMRDPQTGLLAIDQKNATKLALGGLASTQKQLDDQQAEIERLRRSRGQSEMYIPRRAGRGQ